MSKKQKLEVGHDFPQGKGTGTKSIQGEPSVKMTTHLPLDFVASHLLFQVGSWLNTLLPWEEQGMGVNSKLCLHQNTENFTFSWRASKSHELGVIQPFIHRVFISHEFGYWVGVFFMGIEMGKPSCNDSLILSRGFILGHFSLSISECIGVFSLPRKLFFYYKVRG